MTDTIIINQMSALGRRIMIRKRQRAEVSGLPYSKLPLRGHFWLLTASINKLARTA